MVGFKNRYMMFEVYLDPDKNLLGEATPIIITKFNLDTAIEDSILINFGECGLGSSLGSYQLKYLNPITKTVIVRTSREEHKQVWSAITLIKSIGNCPVVFNLLDISGCIRAFRDSALKCETEKFEQCRKRLSEEEIREMNKSLDKIKALGN